MATSIFRCTLCLAAVVTLWVVVSAVAGSIHYLRPGPGFDYWNSAMPFLQSVAEGPWHWQLLWERSADAHHLLIPRLLFFLDWQLDDFRGRVLLTTAWFALLASALLIACLLWQGKPDRETFCVALILIALGFGSAHHMNNLAYTFNQQWTSGLLLSLLWLEGLRRACFAQKLRDCLLLGILAGSSALLLAATTFSAPSIFFSWLIMSQLLPIRRRVAISITLLLLLCLLAYGSTLPHLAVLNNPEVSANILAIAPELLGHIAINTFRYLGSPVAEYSLPAGLLLAFAALWPYARLFRRILRKQPLSTFEQLAAGFGSFVIVMALSTAIGRLDPAQVVSPRFRTFVMPFLCCSALLVLQQIQSLSAIRRRAAPIALLALALAVTLPGHWKLLKKYGDEYDQYMPPFVALASGLTHRDAVHLSRLPKFQQEDNRLMLKYRDFLQNQRKGIYATPFYLQLGSAIVSIPNLITGSTTKLTALNDGAYRWEGTTRHCDRDGRIAIVEDSGQVTSAGIVRRSLSGAGWALSYRIFMPYCHQSHSQKWVAYLPPHSPAGKTFHAIVFNRDGSTETAARIRLP